MTPHTNPNSNRATFFNPLKRDGADPWLTYHNGWYYLCTTSGPAFHMRRARRLGDLQTAADTLIWQDTTPGRSRDLWAPEFHRWPTPSGPRWFLYYTASDDHDENHRMYVAESAGDDPRGPYTFRAQLLTDPANAYYAIDGTVLTLPGGAAYFAWCGRPSDAGQGLYIARMDGPTRLVGERVYLPAEGFGCAVVREGPVALQHEGQVFLVYSMCGADTPDYKVGLLIADQTADLLDPGAWRQHPAPVFARSDAGGVYGPGHNHFFRSPDGTEDWIIYHAKSTTERDYHDRSARAQPFTWNKDGLPNFGVPLPLSTPIPAPSGESPPSA